MITLSQYSGLTERFVNALPEDLELKERYKQQVWDLLQESYASIGGIKGSGFKNPNDMLNIPMWKMVIKDGTVHAVVLYKDKSGRKSVAMGSDGSEYAKKHITDIVGSDITRSYGEKSKAALGFIMKTVPWSVLEHFVMTPEEASKILNKPVTPIVQVDELPKDAEATLWRYPVLRDYGYLRELNGTPTFKVMFGTAGKSIS